MFRYTNNSIFTLSNVFILKMQPKVTPGSGNKVMSKKQRKEHERIMAEKAEANAIVERDKRWAKEIETYLDIRRAFGSTCFP